VKQELELLQQTAIAAVSAASDLTELEALRVKYLGRKGEVTAILKQMGGLSADERPVVGAMANELRLSLETLFSRRSDEFERSQANRKLAAETLDVTIPGVRANALGHKHPFYSVWDELISIFLTMGFTVAEGPEVELSAYCFDKLNTPPDHPARDRQDTFYLDEAERVCLRTQTSSVQVRTMERVKPPIRIISPGKVYRKDEIDATHSPMFHQCEALVVDRGITMGNLKWTLNEMLRGLYGNDVRTRFRPHHFPYTEPSCEVDVQCFECGGSGCRVCKYEGWIELLGAGMVHPKVLAGCGIDPDVYSGFAFGVGIERLTMRRFKINDLRLLFENDLRFLTQF
jgi:phenylalanyl-tRNA synthetase alpha chain